MPVVVAEEAPPDAIKMPAVVVVQVRLAAWVERELPYFPNGMRFSFVGRTIILEQEVPASRDRKLGD